MTLSGIQPICVYRVCSWIQALSSPGQTLYVHEQSLWARACIWPMYIAGMAYMGSDRYIPRYLPTHLSPTTGWVLHIARAHAAACIHAHAHNARPRPRACARARRQTTQSF